MFIDLLEFGVVNGNYISTEELQVSAEEREFAVDLLDSLAIIPAEISNRLKVWGKTSDQTLTSNFHFTSLTIYRLDECG